MKKVWLNVADSFEAAERFDKHYYQRMSATARLETVQFLREIYYKLKWRYGAMALREHNPNGGLNGSRKRLRRVIKVVQ